MIGYNASYAKDLAKYPFVHVRVSLKGCNEEEFSLLTDAKPEGFDLQLKALKNLAIEGVSCHPAVLASFSPKKNQEYLVQRLASINQSLADNFETEELILYPSVSRKIHKYGLKWFRDYTPNGKMQKKNEI